jgi:hypothetical protein
MKLWFDPSPEQIETIFQESTHNAAKWLKWRGKLVCWCPEEANHAKVARWLHLDGPYEKGLMVPAASSMPQ